MDYSDDTTINAVLPILLSSPQMLESLNQDLAEIYSWYLKWHIRQNPKKTKSTVVSRSWTYAPGNADLTLDGAEFEEVRSLSILGVTFDFKLASEIYLRKVGPKATRSLDVVCRAR